MKPENQDIQTTDAKVIPIQLDRVRNLTLDANALALIEEQTGKNVMRGEFRPDSATDIRLFFWACLVQDDPDLTLEQVGEFMLVHQLPEAIEIILRLLTNKDPDPDHLAPFVPTPITVIDRALELATLKAGEHFLDLGCGDGRVVAQAAKIGAYCIGVENDSERVKLANGLIEAMGVRDRATIVEALVQDYNINPVTSVVFVYLLTKSNSKLKRKLLDSLGDDARVVSHDFEFSGWTPCADHTMEAESTVGTTHRILVYRIGDNRPAKVGADAAGEADALPIR